MVELTFYFNLIFIRRTGTVKVVDRIPGIMGVIDGGRDLLEGKYVGIDWKWRRRTERSSELKP